VHDRAPDRDAPTEQAPDGVVDLESCQGGSNISGGSLAQVLADRTGHDVKGWTGRVTYHPSVARKLLRDAIRTRGG
jgi:hypothetical protein